MASRACRLGPFERIAPVIAEGGPMGNAGARRVTDELAPRSINAPIVFVEGGDRQASVVHNQPLEFDKRGRSFFFGKAKRKKGRYVQDDEPTRAERAESRHVESEPQSAVTQDQGASWETVAGAPPSLFGDVVYEALTSPWANAGSEPSRLLLQGRLEVAEARSATLFGDWTGPGASIAAELSKKSFDDVSASSRSAPPRPPKSDDEIFFSTDDK